MSSRHVIQFTQHSQKMSWHSLRTDNSRLNRLTAARSATILCGWLKKRSICLHSRQKCSRGDILENMKKPDTDGHSNTQTCGYTFSQKDKINFWICSYDFVNSSKHGKNNFGLEIFMGCSHYYTTRIPKRT